MRQAVRRSRDGELVGWTSHCIRGVQALSPFGCPLALFDEEWEAEEWLLDHGLGMLARPWQVHDHRAGGWFLAEIMEAGETWVTLRLSDNRHPDAGTLVTLEGQDLGRLIPPHRSAGVA